MNRINHYRTGQKLIKDRNKKIRYVSHQNSRLQRMRRLGAPPKSLNQTEVATTFILYHLRKMPIEGIDT